MLTNRFNASSKTIEVPRKSTPLHPYLVATIRREGKKKKLFPVNRIAVTPEFIELRPVFQNATHLRSVQILGGTRP